MNKGSCSNCQAKAKKKKNPKKIRDDEDKDKGSQGTVDQKKKNVLTWQQHSITKKEKAHHHGNNLLNPPCYSAKPMMYHGGTNPSKLWPVYASPRGHFPPFSVPYGPIQSMYGGAYISPYPPMAAPYLQPRAPLMDTNPMTLYTSYLDNYSYFYI